MLASNLFETHSPIKSLECNNIFRDLLFVTDNHVYPIANQELLRIFLINYSTYFVMNHAHFVINNLFNKLI